MAKRELTAIAIRARPGLIADDTEFAVGQAGFTEINGVRPFRGGMETCRGFEFFQIGQFTGKCRGLFSWRDNALTLNLAVGTHTNLYVDSGGLLLDISPGQNLLAEDNTTLVLEDDVTPIETDEFFAGNEDGYGSSGYGTGGYGFGGYSVPGGGDAWALTWSFGQYGQNLIANPKGQRIYVWRNDLTLKAVTIPNAPERCNCIVVTDRHIIAYGCSEELSGVYNPRCVRWCDFENIEDWTTSTTNNAGEFILDEAGAIVRALQVGSAVYIWTVNGLHVQQFVGAPGQTYAFDFVADGCGLAGPNACIVLGQTAYWMSRDRKLWMMPFGMPPVRLVSPVIREVADNLSAAQEDKVYASTRSEFNEVRWYYPDQRDGSGLECSRYISYNVAERAWSSGLKSRTAEIDQSNTIFPVASGDDGYLYYEEKGFSANGGALSWSARTGFFYLQEGSKAISLRRFWPDFEDRQGIVTLTLYGRMEPQGSETIYGPYTVLPGQTVIDVGGVDGLPTAAMFAIEWSASAAQTFARFGRHTMNAVIRGRGVR